MNIKPLADRILVKPAPAEEKTASGIIIPDTVQERPLQGEVVAVGPGRYTDGGTFIKTELKVGDKVLYGRYSINEIKIDGIEYLIMKEVDVYAII